MYAEIICDLLHPIVACGTLQGSTDPPCTLDMRIYPSDMMIIPLVFSYQNLIPTITGWFQGVITDSAPDRWRFATIFGLVQGLCKPRRISCRQKGRFVERVLAHSKEI